MTITATHINYYHICHRKLWLFAHGINMEQHSDLVTEGRLIGEHSYADRPVRYTEIELDGIKIDYYDARNKIVHEVKKSDKMESAHEAQVKYYLYKLWLYGIRDATAILEYPKLRHTAQVILTDQDIASIRHWESEIERIASGEHVPPVIDKPVCKRCSYFDFCYC